ncbi:hypothetical protein L914_21364 [Phytophthora nicotianae]|uniref:Uncharacterized protein n=1 Tax=Phytophthora nicotianae TaxID=4792 RepID=W2M635_PHYNI|nr:hypothetical protein L914_21364 [Phytophthora nicotianae]
MERVGCGGGAPESCRSAHGRAALTRHRSVALKWLISRAHIDHSARVACGSSTRSGAWAPELISRSNLERARHRSSPATSPRGVKRPVRHVGAESALRVDRYKFTSMWGIKH